MPAKKKVPSEFSAYLIVSSDEPRMAVDSILIDKGVLLVRDWEVMNFETGKMTGAVGRRLSRLCADCRTKHSRVGILGHEGECGSDEVKEEGRQVLADAKKKMEAAA